MEKFSKKMFSSHVQLNKNRVSKATSEIDGNAEGWFGVAKVFVCLLLFLQFALQG